MYFLELLFQDEVAIFFLVPEQNSEKQPCPSKPCVVVEAAGATHLLLN